MHAKIVFTADANMSSQDMKWNNMIWHDLLPLQHSAWLAHYTHYTYYIISTVPYAWSFRPSLITGGGVNVHRENMNIPLPASYGPSQPVNIPPRIFLPVSYGPSPPIPSATSTCLRTRARSLMANCLLRLQRWHLGHVWLLFVAVTLWKGHACLRPRGSYCSCRWGRRRVLRGLWIRWVWHHLNIRESTRRLRFLWLFQRGDGLVSGAVENGVKRRCTATTSTR